MDAAKKDCILLQATRAFSRFGFKKASIDEIAREAGVAKGTVYLAAESKEDLFYQALHREVRAWQAECARTIDPRVPAPELLARLLATAMDYVEKHPLVRDLLLGETLRAMPDWSERLEELRAIGRTHVVEVLRIGIRQKAFRPDLEVDIVAGLLQDFQLAASRGPRTVDRADEVADRVRVGLDLVLHGLGRHDATGPSDAPLAHPAG